MGTCFREVALCGRNVDLVVGTVHSLFSGSCDYRGGCAVLATGPLFLRSLSQLCGLPTHPAAEAVPGLSIGKALCDVSIVPSVASAAVKLGVWGGGGMGGTG